MNKNLICMVIIAGLCLVEGFRTDNSGMVFQSVFFGLLMLELDHVKTMIKNISPWY